MQIYTQGKKNKQQDDSPLVVSQPLNYTQILIDQQLGAETQQLETEPGCLGIIITEAEQDRTYTV